MGVGVLRNLYSVLILAWLKLSPSLYLQCVYVEELRKMLFVSHAKGSILKGIN